MATPVRFRALLVLGIAAVVASTTSCSSRAGSDPQDASGRSDGGSVEVAMETMSRAFKHLRDIADDGTKRDDAVRTIGEMQRACIAAKNLGLPPNVMKGAKDDAAKALLADTFRSDLIALLRKLLDLEQSVMDGKQAAIAAQLADVAKMRDDAHQSLGVRHK